MRINPKFFWTTITILLFGALLYALYSGVYIIGWIALVATLVFLAIGFIRGEMKTKSDRERHERVPSHEFRYRLILWLISFSIPSFLFVISDVATSSEKAGVVLLFAVGAAVFHYFLYLRNEGFENERKRKSTHPTLDQEFKQIDKYVESRNDLNKQEKTKMRKYLVHQLAVNRNHTMQQAFPSNNDNANNNDLDEWANISFQFDAKKKNKGESYEAEAKTSNTLPAIDTADNSAKDERNQPRKLLRGKRVIGLAVIGLAAIIVIGIYTILNLATPENVHRPVYLHAKTIIKTIDTFLEKEITADYARDVMLKDYQKRKIHKDESFTTEDSEIFKLCLELRSLNMVRSTILDTRNKLALLIREPERDYISSANPQ